MASPFTRALNPISASLRPLPPKPGVSRRETVEESPEGTTVEVEERAAGEAPDADDGDAKALAGYSGPEERCKSCAHFEGGKCSIHGFECDPEGTCVDFEAGAHSELPVESAIPEDEPDEPPMVA